MTEKEKMLLALNHKNGPIPLDIGGLPVTGIHCSTLEKLREYYGLEKRRVTIIEPYQMLGMVEDDLRAAIGIDTTPLWSPDTMFGFANKEFKEWTTPWGQEVLVAKDFNVTKKDGRTYIYAQGDTSYTPSAMMPESSFFFDTINRQPKEIDDDALDVQDNLEEFGFISNETLENLRLQKNALGDSNLALLGNFGGTGLGDIAIVGAPMLKQPKGIRDIEEWYVSTITRQDYLYEIFEKQTVIALNNLQKVWEVLGDAVVCAYVCGTDFGTQRVPFCSSETFRRLHMPHYKTINNWIHSHTTWKTFKHSCGAIYPLIPDMIESGFDIINPVQWTADGMDREILKKDFGKDIVFWGGGIDTQHTLPSGTPEQVRREVLETCDIFARDGGFVFNTIHNIQAMVPVENIVAMINALHEYNGGK